MLFLGSSTYLPGKQFSPIYTLQSRLATLTTYRAQTIPTASLFAHTVKTNLRANVRRQYLGKSGDAGETSSISADILVVYGYVGYLQGTKPVVVYSVRTYECFSKHVDG